MNSLIIIGASGHGKVVADIALKMNKWKNIFFLDDDENTKECLGLPVVGKISDVAKFKDNSDIVVAIGNNKIREKLQCELERKSFSIAVLIHPQAIIGKNVEINKGSVVMAGVAINSSSIIGKGCIINTGATVDHDNFIDDYVHISPGAKLAGTVSVGKKSWIGIGATVINNINIVQNTIIGAGSVVLHSINESGTYVGNPLRMVFK